MSVAVLSARLFWFGAINRDKWDLVFETKSELGDEDQPTMNVTKKWQAMQFLLVRKDWVLNMHLFLV